MAFQSVPNAAEIIIAYTLGGQSVSITFAAHRPAGYDSTHIEALAAYLDANAVLALLARQSIYLTYVKTIVRGLTSENDLLREDSTNTGVGAINDLSLPGDRALCITKLSPYTGRSARGRVYVPGIPVGDLLSGAANVGLIQSARAALFVAAIDTFRVDIAAGGLWNPVIVSRYASGIKRAQGVTFPWVSTVSKDHILDTRRSRRR